MEVSPPGLDENARIPDEYLYRDERSEPQAREETRRSKK